MIRSKYIFELSFFLVLIGLTPIFKNNGFQIIILRDIRPFININVANPNEVAQIKNMLEDKIFNEKSESVVEDFLRDTYSKASINIISEY